MNPEDRQRAELQEELLTGPRIGTARCKSGASESMREFARGTVKIGCVGNRCDNLLRPGQGCKGGEVGLESQMLGGDWRCGTGGFRPSSNLRRDHEIPPSGEYLVRML